MREKLEAAAQRGEGRVPCGPDTPGVLHLQIVTKNFAARYS
jgi:hypothetical protein